jgi:hypothetical protein
MKNVFALLLALFCKLAIAAPGDTTIIQGHQNLEMTYTGWYNQMLYCPNNNVSYKRILLEYKIGKYVCPGSPQYCGSWDYLMNFTLRSYATGWDYDSFEVARTITPYATTTGNFPNTWSHTYYQDITDYAPLLKDSALLRAKFGGYSYGFTLNTRILLIEGAPERKVVHIDNIYPLRTQYYGDSANAMENIFLTPKTCSLPSTATHAEFVHRITGHGSNPNDGCGEFCIKHAYLKLNSNTIADYKLWKTCGLCEIPAQTGTWIFDRANWCPGERVQESRTQLPIQAGSTYTLDLDMQPYLYNGSQAHYDIAGQIVYYEDISKNLDAEVLDIVVPSTKSEYKNANPSCTAPIIILRNKGKNAMTSAVIKYGLAGSTLSTFTWTGNLAQGQQERVLLTSIADARTWADGAQFICFIEQLEGQPITVGSGDTAYSTYLAAPSLPQAFTVSLRTNNTAVTSGGAYNETSWQIFDQQFNTYAERINNANNAVYLDTIKFNEGCYQLQVTDTGYADGINFWYYQYYTQNPLNGSMRLLNTSGSAIPFSISKFDSKYYGGDFGGGLTYNFRVNYPTALNNYSTLLDVYPNPANDMLHVNIDNLISAQYKIRDLQGRIKLQGKLAANQTISISELADGTYLLSVEDNKGAGNKLFTKAIR